MEAWEADGGLQRLEEFATSDTALPSDLMSKPPPLQSLGGQLGLRQLSPGFLQACTISGGRRQTAADCGVPTGPPWTLSANQFQLHHVTSTYEAASLRPGSMLAERRAWASTLAMR